jgi:hypothetical protein
MPLLRYIFFLTGVVVVAGGLHPLLSLGFDAFVLAFASALYLLLLLKPFWPSSPGHFQPFYPLLQSPFKPFLRPSHLLCATRLHLLLSRFPSLLHLHLFGFMYKKPLLPVIYTP